MNWGIFVCWEWSELHSVGTTKETPALQSTHPKHVRKETPPPRPTSSLPPRTPCFRLNRMACCCLWVGGGQGEKASPRPLPFAPSNSGDTPLHLAVWAKNMPLCTLLLDRGCDANATDNAGRTPLYDALNNKSLCTLPLDRGCDVRAKNDAGDTVLHCTRNTSLCTLFLDRGLTWLPRTPPGERLFTPLFQQRRRRSVPSFSTGGVTRTPRASKRPTRTSSWCSLETRHGG